MRTLTSFASSSTTVKAPMSVTATQHDVLSDCTNMQGHTCGTPCKLIQQVVLSRTDCPDIGALNQVVLCPRICIAAGDGAH